MQKRIPPLIWFSWKNFVRTQINKYCKRHRRTAPNTTQGLSYCPDPLMNQFFGIREVTWWCRLRRRCTDNHSSSIHHYHRCKLVLSSSFVPMVLLWAPLRSLASPQSPLLLVLLAEVPLLLWAAEGLWVRIQEYSCSTKSCWCLIWSWKSCAIVFPGFWKRRTQLWRRRPPPMGLRDDWGDAWGISWHDARESSNRYGVPIVSPATPWLPKFPYSTRFTVCAFPNARQKVRKGWSGPNHRAIKKKIGRIVVTIIVSPIIITYATYDLQFFGNGSAQFGSGGCKSSFCHCWLSLGRFSPSKGFRQKKRWERRQRKARAGGFFYRNKST